MSWGELSIERVVHEASSPWSKLSTGRVVRDFYIYFISHHKEISGILLIMYSILQKE
jgi:hypothetical protein